MGEIIAIVIVPLSSILTREKKKEKEEPLTLMLHPLVTRV